MIALHYLLVSFGAIVAGVVLVGFVLKFWPRFGFMDKPHLYGYLRDPVPYSVGVVLLLGYLLMLGLLYSTKMIPINFEFEAKILFPIFLILSLLILVVVSFADDLKKLPPVFRLAVQFVSAILIVLGGARVLEISNPFGSLPLQLGGWSYILSVFWIVAITNLMNFLDGVAGMTSGLGSVAFWVLFALSVWPGHHVTDQSFVTYSALIMGSLTFVVAIFEFYPPKILIGDSGTMFIGFMLGVLSLINGGKLATIALVLLIPIFDGFWIIFRRIKSGQSPMKGDLGHMHHRLLRIGFSERQILISYFVVSFIFGLLAVVAWNTLFKFISLLLLTSGLLVIGYLVWIQEKK